MSGHGSENQSAQVSLADRNYFLVRRLHSLAGIVPVGVFLVVHLLSNAAILGGPEAFQAQVGRIHGIPALTIVEVVGIFIPLAFHGLYGLVIWRSSRPNVMEYRDRGNVRYTLQRMTGIIAFVFIMYHLWQIHWVGKPFGGGAFEYEHGDNIRSAVTTAEAIQRSWWIAPAYALGILASVFHLANGLWTALITWGITIKPRTQRVSGAFCTAFGILLALAGLGALRGFRALEVNPGDSTSPHMAASQP